MAREFGWKALGARARRGTVGLAVALAFVACQRPRAVESGAQQRAPRSARRRAVEVLPARGDERLSYVATIDEQLSRIQVEICPSGFRIERLLAPSPGAQELLGGGHIITPEGDYPCPGDELSLPHSKPGECLHYTVDLPEKTLDPTALRRVDRDLLASPDLWLWIPAPRPLGVPMRVHFNLPKGVLAALPWPVQGQDFVLSETAFSWKAGWRIRPRRARGRARAARR